MIVVGEDRGRPGESCSDFTGVHFLGRTVILVIGARLYRQENGEQLELIATNEKKPPTR